MTRVSKTLKAPSTQTMTRINILAFAACLGVVDAFTLQLPSCSACYARSPSISMTQSDINGDIYWECKQAANHPPGKSPQLDTAL